MHDDTIVPVVDDSAPDTGRGAPLADDSVEQRSGSPRARTPGAVEPLERRVELRTCPSERCSAFAAELAVLNRLSESMLSSRSVEAALDETLADCLDAAGVSGGALYMLNSAGELTARAVGSARGWAPGELDRFLGHRSRLLQTIAGADALSISSAEDFEGAAQLLSKAACEAMLVLPLQCVDRPLGALVMMTHRRDLMSETWRIFARAIANQVCQAVALTAAMVEREDADRRAKERTAFLDAVFDQLPDHVVFVDRDGIARYASHATSSALGGSISGRSIRELAPRDPDEAMERLRRILSNGEAESWEEVQPDDDGTERTFWCKMGAVRRGDAVVGAVAVARDITDKKAADALLLESERMASVGLLAAGVAHEINNPLAAVVMNLESALAGLREAGRQFHVPPAITGALEDAREASDRIRTIMGDLKLFSRQPSEERTAVDVNDMIESSLRMCWTVIRYRATLVKEFDKVPPVVANKARLGQVLINVVVNAAQAIPEGRSKDNKIRIETRCDERGRVVISVRDTGCGMSPDVLSRIFTPFFTTKPVGVGTGLGLPICQKIIRAFGGEITVESEVGRGTEFRVALPAADAVSPAPVDPPDADAELRGRVLVIDDDEMIASALRRALSRDHDTFVATAVESLQRLQDGERWGVILCDLMMPQITGMELHAAIRELDPGQASSMVFLTGGAFTPTAREFLDRVDNHRVHKPFDLRDLRALVNRMITEGAAAEDRGSPATAAGGPPMIRLAPWKFSEHTTLIDMNTPNKTMLEIDDMLQELPQETRGRAARALHSVVHDLKGIAFLLSLESELVKDNLEAGPDGDEPSRESIEMARQGSHTLQQAVGRLRGYLSDLGRTIRP